MVRVGLGLGAGLGVRVTVRIRVGVMRSPRKAVHGARPSSLGMLSEISSSSPLYARLAAHVTHHSVELLQHQEPPSATPARISSANWRFAASLARIECAVTKRASVFESTDDAALSAPARELAGGALTTSRLVGFRDRGLASPSTWTPTRPPSSSWDTTTPRRPLSSGRALSEWTVHDVPGESIDGARESVQEPACTDGEPARAFLAIFGYEYTILLYS